MVTAPPAPPPAAHRLTELPAAGGSPQHHAAISTSRTRAQGSVGQAGLALVVHAPGTARAGLVGSVDVPTTPVMLPGCGPCMAQVAPFLPWCAGLGLKYVGIF